MKDTLHTSVSIYFVIIVFTRSGIRLLQCLDFRIATTCCFETCVDILLEITRFREQHVVTVVITTVCWSYKVMPSRSVRLTAPPGPALESEPESENPP